MSEASQKRYLACISEQFPTVQSLYTEIINLKAILNLPKGTEHFMSDIHGEYEAFLHILNNCSGVIREKALRCLEEEIPHGIAVAVERMEFKEHIVNIDATIIAQAPKMRPHIDQMRQNMAAALKIDVSQINVKATTEEGLGFTGAGEGISAQAICLLNSPMGLYDQNVTSGCGGCGGRFPPSARGSRRRLPSPAAPAPR